MRHRESLSFQQYLTAVKRPLSRYSCSSKVWRNIKTKHTTGKSKPKLVSGPIVRVIHQSVVKRWHFGNFNFYKVLYVVCHTEPYKKYNFQIDGASQYFGVWLTIGPLTNFGFLFPVVCYIVCLAKLYRSCPIRDIDLLRMEENTDMNDEKLCTWQLRAGYRSSTMKPP